VITIQLASEPQDYGTRNAPGVTWTLLDYDPSTGEPWQVNFMDVRDGVDPAGIPAQHREEVLRMLADYGIHVLDRRERLLLILRHLLSLVRFWSLQLVLGVGEWVGGQGVFAPTQTVMDIYGRQWAVGLETDRRARWFWSIDSGPADAPDHVGPFDRAQEALAAAIRWTEAQGQEPAVYPFQPQDLRCEVLPGSRSSSTITTFTDGYGHWYADVWDSGMNIWDDESPPPAHESREDARAFALRRLEKEEAALRRSSSRSGGPGK